MTPWLLAIAALAIGLLLILSDRGIRQRRGLSEGRTLDLGRVWQ
jgi:hypothetical protein